MIMVLILRLQGVQALLHNGPTYMKFLLHFEQYEERARNTGHLQMLKSKKTTAESPIMSSELKVESSEKSWPLLNHAPHVRLLLIHCAGKRKECLMPYYVYFLLRYR